MKIILCAVMILFNFILYFCIGSLVTGRMKKNGYSVTVSVFMGFFLYYSMFTLVCLPIMYRWRPLSMLTKIWSIIVGILLILSLCLNRKLWISKSREMMELLKQHKWFVTGLFVLFIIEIVVILYSYQFTLDAAYYVANVTTSIQTDSMNIYDPYTGNWQDHFEMRYFFATYPMNDAVMCQLFPFIHPLMQTKLIMAAVAVLLTNLLYYMIGRELFGEKREAIFYLCLLAGIMNFFFITIYTSSNFLITRTYEGKCLLGNVVLPGILYLYIKIWKQQNRRDERPFWGMLFLVCFGATVLSSSSNMLVPATLAILFLPLSFIKKDFRVLIKTGLCMLPCLMLLLLYVAYVKGIFVFYTYPR